MGNQFRLNNRCHGSLVILDNAQMQRGETAMQNRPAQVIWIIQRSIC